MPFQVIQGSSPASRIGESIRQASEQLAQSRMQQMRDSARMRHEQEIQNRDITMQLLIHLVDLEQEKQINEHRQYEIELKHQQRLQEMEYQQCLIDKANQQNVKTMSVNLFLVGTILVLFVMLIRLTHVRKVI
jgi:hypothetical protein